MRSRRIRRSRKAVLAAVVVVSGMMLLASAGVAVVPPTVDSYGDNAFAAGVHAIVGSNNDPNFSNGAVGNRYPLTSAGQDISPASAATASIDDYGPLVATVAGNDCNNPPPSPLHPKPPAVAQLLPRAHPRRGTLRAGAVPKPAGSGRSNRPGSAQQWQRYGQGPRRGAGGQR